MVAAYFRAVWPAIKKRIRVFQRKELLAKTRQEIIDNGKKWVIVYGATNNVGKQVSKVLAKHGYSLVLIDVNLDKLQQVKNELIRVFPHLTQVAED